MPDKDYRSLRKNLDNPRLNIPKTTIYDFVANSKYSAENLRRCFGDWFCDLQNVLHGCGIDMSFQIEIREWSNKKASKAVSFNAYIEDNPPFKDCLYVGFELGRLKDNIMMGITDEEYGEGLALPSFSSLPELKMKIGLIYGNGN